MKRKLGWHWIDRSRKLGYQDGRKVEVGERLEMLERGDATKRPPQVCGYGMHASSKISDAAEYHKGPILCRVVVTGSIDAPSDDNKFCGRYRKVLWMAEITMADLKPIARELKIPLSRSQYNWMFGSPTGRFTNRAYTRDDLLNLITEHKDGEKLLQRLVKSKGCPTVK